MEAMGRRGRHWKKYFTTIEVNTEIKGIGDDMKVVVIGSGLMGSAIAARSALAGNLTVLVDISEVNAKKGVTSALACVNELVEHELATAEQKEKAQAYLTYSCDKAQALQGAEFVIEAIVENLDAKQKLFEELDNLLPAGVPILSNTSGLRITDIAANVSRYPERTMTAHFWFPAHLVPLVEVVMWEKTDPQLAEYVRDILKVWGKAPVIVKRDLPGQLANRMLQAIIREAVNTVSIGLASPEDVDTAIKMGMGIRLPAWGILEHIDGVGLDLATSVQDTVLPELSCAQEAAPMLKDMVSKGDLGYKTGRGLYDWNVKDMDKLARKRNEFIIQALRTLEKFD